MIELDVAKTNTSMYFTYEVEFTEKYSIYKGEVTVDCRHMNLEDFQKSVMREEDGSFNIDFYTIFKRCAKKVHGLVYKKNGKQVEYTPKELCDLPFGQIDINGQESSPMILEVILNTARYILTQYRLTTEEEKNLSAESRG